MNLDEAILYARIEGPGPHVAQQALGLLVGEIDRLRQRVSVLEQSVITYEIVDELIREERSLNPTEYTPECVRNALDAAEIEDEAENGTYVRRQVARSLREEDSCTCGRDGVAHWRGTGHCIYPRP